MNTETADNRPHRPASQQNATPASRWNITIYHPDGTVEEKQADFAEMVQAAAHSRFTASPAPAEPD